MSIDYAALCKRSQDEDWPIKYETFVVWKKNESPAIRMTHKKYPVGLKEAEANFLYNFVKDHNLQHGFEVATGFGMSSLAAGLAFKETGGKIVTLDSYIEESKGDPNIYKDTEDETSFEIYDRCDGLRSASQFQAHFDLGKHHIAIVGSSPGDVAKHCTSETVVPLDYVFIDAGHWDEAVLRDLNAVLPLLAEKRVVFFHDLHCFKKETIAEIERLLGGEIVIAVAPPNGWNLGYISNL